MKTLINIWMMPVYARLNMESRRSLYVVLALFPIVGQLVAGAIFYSKGTEAKLSLFFYAFLASMAACIVLIIFVWMVTLVMNFGLQYSPANAALVPDLKRKLQLALAIPIVLTALISVISTFLVTQKLTMLPAFVSILVCSFFIGLMRSQWFVIPAMLASQLPILFKRNDIVDLDKFDVLSQGIGFELILFVASVLILLGMLHWFFLLRDEAHFKLHKRTQTMRDGINSRDIPINKFATSLYSLFAIWMQTCVRRSQKSMKQGEALKLSVFALGPQLHWTTIIVQLFLMMVMGVLMVALMEIVLHKTSKDFLLGFAIGFPWVILVGVPLVFCIFSFFTLYRTRTEQALFCLAPSVETRVKLDRILTNYLLRQFLILLSISVLSTFALIQFAANIRLAPELLTLALSCVFVFVLAMTHQFASMKAATDHPLMKLGLIAGILLVLGIVMTIFISSQIAWWLSAAIVLTTSVTLMVRLKRNAQTVQFPVGRAAN